MQLQNNGSYQIRITQRFCTIETHQQIEIDLRIERQPWQPKPIAQQLKSEITKRKKMIENGQTRDLECQELSAVLGKSNNSPVILPFLCS